jgi:hypothetical protein
MKGEESLPMRHTPLWVLGLAVAPFLMGAAIVLAATDVHAQVLSYSAKFVCGTRSTDGGVVRGVYATTVNIHNPHLNPLSFRKKAVIALPQRSTPGAISGFVGETLKPDEALGVDCQDIRELFSPALSGFIEGFLVILVDGPELDVMGVYTARHRSGTDTSDPAQYDVESINVVEVRPKRPQ